MASKYNKQKQAQPVVWAALVDLQRQMFYCEHMADIENGQRLTAYNPGPLTVDAQGEVVKNCDYWQTIRQNVRQNRDNWLQAYLLMFCGGKNGETNIILRKITEEAEADPIADPVAVAD